MGRTLALALLMVCAACDADAPPAAPGSAEPSSSAALSVSPTATPRATAPPELQGLWQATISTGEEVTLELRPTAWFVTRSGAQGNGSIRFDGDRIIFTSARCELGVGTYEWAVEGGTLMFTPVEPRDPCSNRIIFLEGAAYTRVE